MESREADQHLLTVDYGLLETLHPITQMPPVGKAA